MKHRNPAIFIGGVVHRKCWSDKPDQPCWCREIHCSKEEDSEVIGYGAVNEDNAALICDAVNLIKRQS